MYDSAAVTMFDCQDPRGQSGTIRRDWRADSMKTLCAAVTLGFAVLVVQCCSAQEIKTVNQCRTYRETWRSSADSDTKELTVRELVQRAGQMMTCGKEIDKEPLQSGMTATETLMAAWSPDVIFLFLGLYFFLKMPT
jgi:hypothetical protein